MAKVILTRHGETIFNIEKRITGRGSNPPLTEKGISDTHLFADRLSAEWGNHIDLIVSSSMHRTNQTAEIFNSKLNKNIIYDTEVQEIDHGSFEGLYGPSIFPILDNSPEDVHPAGGESRVQFRERISKSICEYLYQDLNTILIVSHGWTGTIAHNIFLEEEIEHFPNNHFIILDPDLISDLPGKCSCYNEKDLFIDS